MSTTIITDQPINYEFVATAGQDQFNCDCQLFDSEPVNDVVVTIDGVETVDFTVALVGDEGFSVILDTPCDGGEEVVVERDLAVERVSQFELSGPLAIESLNHELNRIVALIQQLAINYLPFSFTAVTGEPGGDVEVVNVGTVDEPIWQLTIPVGAAGGSGIWGSITGDILDQDDLQDALDLKADAADLTTLETTVTNLAAALETGTYELPVMASAMTRRTTNGPSVGSLETTTNKVMWVTYDFDKATDEFAQLIVPFGAGWNRSTIQVQFGWRSNTGAGDVVWGAQAVAISNSDLLDSAFGAAQTVTDAVEANTDLMVSAYTPAITVAGTPADADAVAIQIFRNADDGSDNLDDDAKLAFIRVKFTTDDKDDA